MRGLSQGFADKDPRFSRQPHRGGISKDESLSGARRQWGTEEPGVCRPGGRRVGHDLATERQQGTERPSSSPPGQQAEAGAGLHAQSCSSQAGSPSPPRPRAGTHLPGRTREPRTAPGVRGRSPPEVARPRTVSIPSARLLQPC